TGLGANRVGRPTDPGDVLTGGPMFGPRLGIFPIPRVGIEAQLALAIGGHQTGTDAAPLVLPRVQVVVRGYDRGRIGVRALAGAGVITTLDDRGTSHAGSAGEVHAGLAMTVETRRDLWLRLQVADVVTTARDAGFAHCAEIELG